MYIPFNYRQVLQLHVGILDQSCNQGIEWFEFFWFFTSADNKGKMNLQTGIITNVLYSKEVLIENVFFMASLTHDYA